MFKGNTNTSGEKSPSLNSPDRLNRIVEGTRIVGEIDSESNIRIDGTVEGTIKTKGRLVVGPKGKIIGDVICNDAEIEGTVEGQIKVDALLSLRSTAKITGDMFTGKLAIEPGATFTGNCNMGGVVKEMSKPKQVSKPELVEESA